MSVSNGDDHQYTTGEIALTMTIVTLVLLVPLLAGTIYYIGWL